MLPTIKSRCQILRFSKPSKKELNRYYSKLGYDNEKIELLSSLSQFGYYGGTEENYFNFIENRMEKFHILEKLIRKDIVEEVLLSLFGLSKTRSKFIVYFEEMVNLLSATRGYEANTAAIKSAKDMALKALEIGR